MPTPKRLSGVWKLPTKEERNNSKVIVSSIKRRYHYDIQAHRISRDVTFASETLARRVTDWTRKEHECCTTTKWNIAKVNTNLLARTTETRKDEIHAHSGAAEKMVNAAMSLIVAYLISQKKMAIGTRKMLLTGGRAKLRRNPEAAVRESEELRSAKKELKMAIHSSKKRRWDELRRDNDPWGLGYKIVCKKSGAMLTCLHLDTNQVQHIFPEEIFLFTEEEVTRAATVLWNGTAAGLDGIPAEVLLLHIYNKCLEEGLLPRNWKVQRLVLINKDKSNLTASSAYKILCMLDTAGKLFEKLLKARLSARVEDAGGLPSRQDEFRRNHSTISAIREVLETYERAQRVNPYSRGIVMLLTLDVRNAFNTVRWVVILDTLAGRFNIPPLSDAMTVGLQGRLYRRCRPRTYTRRRFVGVLRLEMPDNSCLAGYADDLAAVIVARGSEDRQRVLNQVM
ncbi:hypothetical protein Trydic_g11591 [Trypoxylus dichotomus]